MDHLSQLRRAAAPGAEPVPGRPTSSPGRGLIAVRPDGYIGFRGQTVESGQLNTWLTMLRVGVAQGPVSGDLSTYPRQAAAT